MNPQMMEMAMNAMVRRDQHSSNCHSLPPATAATDRLLLPLPRHSPAASCTTEKHVTRAGMCSRCAVEPLAMHARGAAVATAANSRTPCMMPPMQIQAMMSSMGNMDPGLMQQQMRMMQNMSPVDLQRAQQQMSGMDPNTLASQAEQAQKMLSAQQKYALDVSVCEGVWPVAGKAATATTCAHCLSWDLLGQSTCDTVTRRLLASTCVLLGCGLQGSNMLKADGNKLHAQGTGSTAAAAGSPHPGMQLRPVLSTASRSTHSRACARRHNTAHAGHRAGLLTGVSAVAAGRYTEAAEKYARARDNLEGMTNSQAVTLRRACVLNLSSCYLNNKKYRQCVDCCQEVLSGELVAAGLGSTHRAWTASAAFLPCPHVTRQRQAGMSCATDNSAAEVRHMRLESLYACACLLHAEDTQNLKALYRRGQAYAALHEYQEAEQDLTAAAALSGSDPQQLQLIKEKLAAVREQLAAKPPAPAKQQQQQAPQPQPQPAAQQEEQHPKQQEQGRKPQQAADSTADSRSRHQQEQQEKQAPGKAAAASMEEEDGLIEEIKDDRVPGSSRQQQAQVVMDSGDAGAAPAARSTSSQAKRAAAAAAASSGRSAATALPLAGGLGDMSAQMQQMAEMMRSNPGMMRQVRQRHEWVAAAWGLLVTCGWFVGVCTHQGVLCLPPLSSCIPCRNARCASPTLPARCLLLLPACCTVSLLLLPGC